MWNKKDKNWSSELHSSGHNARYLHKYKQTMACLSGFQMAKVWGHKRGRDTWRILCATTTFYFSLTLFCTFQLKKCAPHAAREPGSQRTRKHQANPSDTSQQTTAKGKSNPKSGRNTPMRGWVGGESWVGGGGRTSCHNYNFLMQIKTRCADFSLL